MLPPSTTLPQPLSATTIAGPLPPGHLSVTELPGPGTVSALVRLGDGWLAVVAVDWEGTDLWGSEDGHHWQLRNSWAGWTVTRIGLGEGELLMVGESHSSNRLHAELTRDGLTWEPFDLGPLVRRRLLDLEGAAGHWYAVATSFTEPGIGGTLWRHHPATGWDRVGGQQLTVIASTPGGDVVAGGHDDDGPRLWRVEGLDLVPLPTPAAELNRRPRTFRDLAALGDGTLVGLLGPRVSDAAGSEVWLFGEGGLVKAAVEGPDVVSFQGLVPVEGGMVAVDARRLRNAGSDAPLGWHTADGVRWTPLDAQGGAAGQLHAAAMAAGTLVLGGANPDGGPWLGGWNAPPPAVELPAPPAGEGRWVRWGGIPSLREWRSLVGVVLPDGRELLLSEVGTGELWVSDLAAVSSGAFTRVHEDVYPLIPDGFSAVADGEGVWLATGGATPGVWRLDPATGVAVREAAAPPGTWVDDLWASDGELTALFRSLSRVTLIRRSEGSWLTQEIPLPALAEDEFPARLLPFPGGFLLPVWRQDQNLAYRWDGREWTRHAAGDLPGHTLRTPPGILGMEHDRGEGVVIPSPDPATWEQIQLPAGWPLALHDRVVVVAPRRLWLSSDLRHWSEVPLDLVHGFTGRYPQVIPGLSSLVVATGGREGLELWRWEPPSP